MCGDLRGNMVLFPLAKMLVLDLPVTQEVKISPMNHFKGVHGISSVSSVSVTLLSLNQIEIRSVSEKLEQFILLVLVLQVSLIFSNDNFDYTVNVQTQKDKHGCLLL